MGCKNQPANPANPLADDVISDSLLDYLSRLRPATDVTSADILLGKNVSVADYAYFLANQHQKHKGGELRLQPEINYALMMKVAAFYTLLTPAQKRRDSLLTRVTDTALYFTTKTNFIDKTAEPAQVGLAYSWGSKKYRARATPDKGDGEDTCTYQIRGLDCSGFFSLLFTKNGIPIIEGRADDQRKVPYVKQAFTTFFGSADDFDVVDMGRLRLHQLITGDIVYFFSRSKQRAYHIGLILKDVNRPLYYFCECHGSPGHCAENLTEGPQLSSLDAVDDFNYMTVRVIPK
jgi:hypothetical protein